MKYFSGKNPQFYFGGGICSDPAGATPYGVPVQRIEIGHTEKSMADIMAHLNSIRHRFTVQTYNLLTHNCNNFSSELVQFLCPGKDIPRFILDLPQECLSTPLGAMLRPTIDAMQQQMAQMGHSAFGAQQQGTDTAAFAAAAAQAANLARANPSAPFPGTSFSTAGATTFPQQQQPLSPMSIAEASRRPVLLGKGDVIQIRKKLAEFAPSSGLADSVSELAAVATSLGAEKAFPALDLLRLMCAQSENNSVEVASILPQLLRDFGIAADAPRPSRMMVLRVACNCLAFDSAACIALTHPDLSELLGEAVANGLAADQHEAVIAASAALACNLGAACIRGLAVTEDLSVRVAFAAAGWLQGGVLTSSTAEGEVIVHALVALGAVAKSHPTASELCRSLELGPSLQSVSHQDPRVQAIAKEVSALLA